MKDLSYLFITKSQNKNYIFQKFDKSKIKDIVTQFSCALLSFFVNLGNFVFLIQKQFIFNNNTITNNLI